MNRQAGCGSSGQRETATVWRYTAAMIIVHASREEVGCISYEFYVGLTDPNTLLLFQEWESVDALQGHFETDHMEEFLKLLPNVLDGEVATRRYEVKVSNDMFEGGDFDPEPVHIEEEREKIIH